ncbi:MAG: hypothetical protein K1X89_08030 [Myxococcaceae bacterium]|nr:hypothetical protein [Myxococcaceae bacterium]
MRRPLAGLIVAWLAACGGAIDAVPDEPWMPYRPADPAGDAGEEPPGTDAGPDEALDAGPDAGPGEPGHLPDAGPATGGHDGGGVPADAGAHDAGLADAGPSSVGPCPKEGGLFCGGNGIAGSPSTLYVCKSGQLVPKEVCAPGPCQAMPAGVPDQCPGTLVVPASLVTLLSPKPYVEVSCVAATYPGWPYPAKRCTYTSGGITTSVTVADPTPDRVARWVVDSATLIPALQKLKGTAQSDYEAGLKAIGLAMLYQSSRIFPLTGGIIENMGSGYVNYPFEKGITQGCSSGCYCRINSLHRTEWCTYQAGIGAQTKTQCLNQVGSSGLTAAWGAECLGNHVRSWNSDVNAHFRAKAFVANQSVASRCPPGACTPAQVVSAVKTAYGL